MKVKSFCKHLGITVPSYDIHLFENFYLQKYYKNYLTIWKDYKNRDNIFVDKNKIVNDIKNDINYPKKFIYDKISFPTNNLYSPQNNNKVFCSIDLKQANFNMFKKYFNIFRDCKEWKDFMKNYTNEYILLKSKYIRSWVFGHLNPKYTQYLQKLTMLEIKELFSDYINKIYFTGNDEMIIEISKNDYKILSNDIKYRLKNYKELLHIRFFKLNEVKTSYGNYYIKRNVEYNDIILDYKGVPREVYTQIVCLCNPDYYQVSSEDLYFDFNNTLCKFNTNIELYSYE